LTPSAAVGRLIPCGRRVHGGPIGRAAPCGIGLAAAQPPYRTSPRDPPACQTETFSRRFLAPISPLNPLSARDPCLARGGLPLERAVDMRIRWFGILVFATVFMVIHGCNRNNDGQQPSDAKRIAVARGQLQSMLDGITITSSGYEAGPPTNARYCPRFAAYMRRHLQEALDALDAGEVPKGPVPVSAAFTITPESQRLMLWFFDPGFEVTGIIVESVGSETRAYPSIFAWTSEARRWYSVTILRDCPIEVIVVEDGGRRVSGTDSNPLLPQIELPEKFLNGQVRLRLLIGEGSTEAIDSYVFYSKADDMAPASMPDDGG